MPDRKNEIVDLFVRDLDRIELPPRDRWRPIPRKESYLMTTSRFVLLAGAVAAVLVAALIVGVGLRDRSIDVAASPSPIPATSTPLPTTTPLPSSSPQATAGAVATPSAPVTAQPGAITGRFAYGSDFLPPVTVYAISTTDSRVWYSVNFIGYGRGRSATPPPGSNDLGSYLLSGVAPGTYWVVAYRTDGETPDPGYYSAQAECSRMTPSGPCPNIGPVRVTVVAGQTASGIDIITWGTQPQPSPTLPPRPTPRP